LKIKALAFQLLLLLHLQPVTPHKTTALLRAVPILVRPFPFEEMHMNRFTAYEVRPALEADIDGDGSVDSKIYNTLQEAQDDAAELRDKEPGIPQWIAWKLNGLFEDKVVKIGSFASEVDAFAVLYGITGIEGVSGQTLYRL
jgi:hypothetical protein